MTKIEEIRARCEAPKRHPEGCVECDGSGLINIRHDDPVPGAYQADQCPASTRAYRAKEEFRKHARSDIPLLLEAVEHLLAVMRGNPTFDTHDEEGRTRVYAENAIEIEALRYLSRLGVVRTDVADDSRAVIL